MKWTPASEPPPLYKNGCSQWVLATDGDGNVAMRFYRHPEHLGHLTRWGGEERGYLWDITHWMPIPERPSQGTQP